MIRSLLSLRLWLLGLVAALIFSSCSKYPDGPTFTLASKQSRIVNDWNAYQITRNNIDENLFFESYGLSIRDNGSFDWSVDAADDSLGAATRSGQWKFISLKEEIQLTFDQPDPDTDQAILVMEIKRLAADDLWLFFFYRGDYYEVQFE